MRITSRDFPAAARRALADDGLQAALGRLREGFVVGRAAAVERLPEFDALRDEARDIRYHTLDHLNIYLERFEQKVIDQGGDVHWCRNAADCLYRIQGRGAGNDSRTGDRPCS